MDFNNNRASALNQQQIIPPATPNPPPTPKTTPRFSTELVLQTVATGASVTTVGVVGFEAYQNVQLRKKEYNLKVKGKAEKIRDSFYKGHINEETAIYKLKNLDLTDQDVVYHLTSTGKYDQSEKATYAIADKKLVRVKTSDDLKMEHPPSGNKEQLDILNEMQGVLHAVDAGYTDFKQKLPDDHPLHPVVDNVLNKHKTSIPQMKVVQCENLSQEKVDTKLTAKVANGIMEDTAFVTEEARSAINLQIKAEKGTQQEQEVVVSPHKEPRSPRQKKSGTGKTASITEAFLQKDKIIDVDDGAKTDYCKVLTDGNPSSSVSERTEKVNTPKQFMGESIPQGRAISCSETPPPSVILFGMSIVLWIVYFYFRNTRLEEEKNIRLKQEKKTRVEQAKSEFQEKERTLANFNNIIKKVKSKELCFEEAQLLLIQRFDLTQSAAAEILLKIFD